jgi:hypothetical protein
MNFKIWKISAFKLRKGYKLEIWISGVIFGGTMFSLSSRLIKH